MSVARLTLSSLFAILLTHGASAMDAVGYESLTKDTVKELVAGSFPDVAKSLSRLEKAMTLGIEACEEYAKANPADAVLIAHAVKATPGMKAMKPDELEAQWGDEGVAGDAIGRPLKDMDQFSMTRNYIDLIVHPARAYDYIVSWKASGDKQELEQAKGELIEVLEHLKKIKAKS
ncbi:hypothetical protein ABEG18_03195 [Alsobacter sp. KACC 23698]|uniref:DUF4142 domain-containing protein n=1 Tax=Alsobacter sp. KACC 23698 TaxID=3149229 RepID=A0AAU7JHN4_9HYPH